MTAFIALRRRDNFRRLCGHRASPGAAQKVGCARKLGSGALGSALAPCGTLLTPCGGSWHHRCSSISSTSGGTMERRQRSFGAGYWCVRSSLALAAVLALASLARAEEAAKVDSGDNAWMLTSSALVLMMTAPGLALFYGGLVRSKNVLGLLMQSFVMVALISIQWVLW